MKFKSLKEVSYALFGIALFGAYFGFGIAILVSILKISLVWISAPLFVAVLFVFFFSIIGILANLK